MRLHRDERGLVGKLLILWLLVVVLVGIAVIDAASIVLARVHTIDLARNAASSGADAFDETGRRRQAVRAARTELAAADEDARMDDLRVSEDGEVTAVVTDRAATLLVGRIGFLDHLSSVTATVTSG